MSDEPVAIQACRALAAWLEGEKSGPDYGDQSRETHPEGERIWSEWWGRQLRMCKQAQLLAIQAIREYEDRCPDCGANEPCYSCASQGGWTPDPEGNSRWAKEQREPGAPK